MLRLILMRHAEAESPLAGQRDQDRPLSERGRLDAVAMGRLLAAQACRPDHALVSSALRTQQTWDLAHEAFGDVEVRSSTSLYNAAAEEIDRLIGQIQDQVGCLIIIAHNPGIHLLARRYVEESAATPSVIDTLAGGFPTAAAAVFKIDGAGRRIFDGYILPPPSR